MSIDSYHFSKREQEVINLLLQGKSNKQIALALHISESTVEFHLKNIYAKLGVSSRTEAFLLLGKSTGGVLPGDLWIPAVDQSSLEMDNRDEPVLQGQESPPMIRKTGLQEIARLFGRYKIIISIGILLVIVIIFVLRRPTRWEGYARECEYPDEATTGQVIERVEASASKVHGQFGAAGEAPWPVRPGYVKYNNIPLPRLDILYLKLRYSKFSAATVPILVYLDDEPLPRAMFYPVDQGSWDRFVWTDAIPLGGVKKGIHAIRLSTDGQQYGVADLDQFILTGKSP